LDYIQNLSPGWYKLTVTDANLCVDTFSYQLIEPPLINFEKIEKMDLSCQFVYDGEIKLQGKGGQGEPYMYSINGGKSFSYTKNYKNLDTGKYHVMVKDANHCDIGDSAYVGFKDKIEINAFPKDTTIELGQRVEIDFDVIKGPLSNINSIEWTPDLALECNICKKTIAFPYQTTVYDLDVKYNNGKCKATDKVIVRIKDNSELFVPNVFTPNGDGNNDVLKVYGTAVWKAKLTIFNRWGEKVFESSNAIIEGWDGYFKGELAPIDVYTYSLEAHFLNRKIKTVKGSITLIR
jgi:gliding motility-associated-like protein